MRILDYKTGDSAQKPEKAHHNGEQWIDLQLPLYRHLWPAARLDVPANCTIELAYFNLPKQLDKTAVVRAEWDGASLMEADEVARQVVRRISSAEFWPPTYPAPDYAEEFAAICLDNRLSSPALGDDDEGAGA